MKRLLGESSAARPRHPAQDERIVEAFQKNFSRVLSARLNGAPETVPIEFWFRDAP